MELFGAGSPATVEVAFGVLPTYRPEGNSLLLFLPGPLAFAFPLPALAPGAPEAARWPSGVAAKVPRRLPAGGFGGAPTAGCRLSAIMPPLEWERPDAPSAGGGAITCGERPLNTAESRPGSARCASRES